MKRFQHPTSVFSGSRRNCEAILWLLRLEGPIVDPNGHARQVMLSRLEDVGYKMSINTLNRFLVDLGPEPKHDRAYPYHYIDIVNTRTGVYSAKSKRTYEVKLCVNAEKVPFPPNPFEAKPGFIGKNGPKPATKPTPTPPVEDEGETFARQAQFEGVALEPAPQPAKQQPISELVFDPGPEPDLELPELEPEVLETTGLLTPYVAEPAAVNGNGTFSAETDLFGEIADDLLLPSMSYERPKDSTAMISAAIGLLSDALAARAQEGGASTADVDRQINARLTEYRILQGELDQAKGQLRHVIGKYEKLITLARQQQNEIKRLKERVAV